MAAPSGLGNLFSGLAEGISGAYLKHKQDEHERDTMVQKASLDMLFQKLQDPDLKPEVKQELQNNFLKTHKMSGDAKKGFQQIFNLHNHLDSQGQQAQQQGQSTNQDASKQFIQKPQSAGDSVASQPQGGTGGQSPISNSNSEYYSPEEKRSMKAADIKSQVSAEEEARAPYEQKKIEEQHKFLLEQKQLDRAEKFRELQTRLDYQMKELGIKQIGGAKRALESEAYKVAAEDGGRTEITDDDREEAGRRLHEKFNVDLAAKQATVSRAKEYISASRERIAQGWERLRQGGDKLFLDYAKEHRMSVAQAKDEMGKQLSSYTTRLDKLESIIANEKTSPSERDASIKEAIDLKNKLEGINNKLSGQADEARATPRMTPSSVSGGGEKKSLKPKKEPFVVKRSKTDGKTYRVYGLKPDGSYTRREEVAAP